MRAEIIAIGDELLIGQVTDTNSVFISQQLNSIGISLQRKSAIGDDKTEIINCLTESLSRVDLVILTGGLGPTSDDITCKTLAEYFNQPLVLNKKVLSHISDFLVQRMVPVTELNKQQAWLPADCDLLWNDIGTAPGMVFRQGKKYIVSMPGVPHELKLMVTGKLLPYLKNHFQLPSIYIKTICVAGIAESILSEKLSDFEKNNSKNCAIAYLPSPGIVRLRLSSSSDKMLGNCVKQIDEILEHYIYAHSDISLQEVTGELLSKRKKTLAIAESCTGGYISHLITSVSGSSDYYSGSVTSYSNEVKVNILGVKQETIDQFGAVSKETVQQMALGIKKKYKADYSIATSGIAGPTGGSEEKPVGTTWIAIAFDNEVIAKRFVFGKERDTNIIKASRTALNMLRLILTNRQKILEKMFD